MGKGGKKGGGGKKEVKTATAAETNAAAAAKALAMLTMEEDGPKPTQAELFAALNSVMTFDLRVAEEGSGGTPCASTEGDWVFYLDEQDAVEALQARKQSHPSQLAIGCTGLGTALGLSEGWIGSNVQYPMRLQGSKSVLSAFKPSEAGALCPPSIRSQMNKQTTAIPMFSLEELAGGRDAAPYFFTRLDMVEYWMEKTGKPEEELPKKVVLTDLRVLAVRMMNVPRDWRTIQIMPTKSSVEWLQAMASGQQAMSKMEKLTGGQAEGQAGGEDAAAKGAPSPGAAPPPLETVSEDEPPPLS